MNKLQNYSEVKFVNLAKISKHLECSICSNFLCQPLRLSCGHTFCNECYLGLRQATQNNQQFRCPLCREAVDLRYVSIDKIAKNLLEEQSVYCLNKSKFCLWQGPLRELEKHIDNCKFKENDEMSQNLIMQFDKTVQQQAMNSNLNTVISNQTFVDEQLQENLNKNVGEQLLVRLFNKNKDIAQSIARSLSVKEESRFTQITKKSADEKSNTNISQDTEDSYDEFEQQKKDDIDLDFDNIDNVFQMFSDEKSDTKEILDSQPNLVEDSTALQKKKQPLQKGRRKSKQKNESDQDEDYNPGQQQQRRRGNKKRKNVGDDIADLELQQKIMLYEQYGIDIDSIL